MILPFPPVLSQTATLELRATSLAGALPKIGEAYGVAMRPAPTIADEIGIFALTSATLEEFKARLADTFAAEWIVSSDGTLVLNRSPRLRSAEERTSLANRRARFTAEIAKVRETARRAAPFTLEAARGRRKAEEAIQAERETDATIGIAVPTARLFDAIVARLTADELIPTGLPSRTVFSTRPTPMQRPFRGDVSPLLATWLAEQTLWNSTDPTNADPVHAPDLVTLVAEYDQTSVALELKVYDAAGALLAESNSTLRSEEPASDASPIARPDDPIIEYKLSPESVRFGRAFDPRASDGVPKGHAEAANFLDPTVRDPMSFEATDLALTLARATGRNLIARVEDAPPYAAIFDADPEMIRQLRAPLSQWLSGFAADTTNPGWLTIRPRDPAYARIEFFPRPTLERALKALYARPRPGFETVLHVAEMIPDSPTPPPLGALLTALAPRTALYDPLMLKFLASLGPAGRKQTEERDVRFEGLSAESRSRLEGWLFDASGVYVQLENKLDARREEITTLLANGLPRGGTVRVVPTLETSFLVPGQGGVEREVRSSLVAAYLTDLKTPTTSNAGRRSYYADLDLDRIRLVPETTRRVRFQLAPDAYVMAVIRTTEEPGKETYTLATLPKTVRAELDEKLVIFEKRAKERDAEPKRDAPPPLLN